MVLLRHIQPKVTVPIFKKSKKSALKMVSLLWAAAPQTKTSFQKCSWSNHIALVASPFNPIRPKRYLFFKNGPKMAIFSSTVFALSLLESLCSNWVNFSWEFSPRLVGPKMKRRRPFWLFSSALSSLSTILSLGGFLTSRHFDTPLFRNVTFLTLFPPESLTFLVTILSQSLCNSALSLLFFSQNLILALFIFFLAFSTNLCLVELSNLQ